MSETWAIRQLEGALEAAVRERQQLQSIAARGEALSADWENVARVDGEIAGIRLALSLLRKAG